MAYEKKELPKKEDYSDIIDEEDYGWGDNSGVNIRKLIFMHINRISENTFIKDKGNTEVKESTKSETLVSNSTRREVFIDAIEYLIALLQPYYDKDATTNIDKLVESIIAVEERFIVASVEKEAYRRSLSDKLKFAQAYNYWCTILKKLQVCLYERGSSDYEMFIEGKYNIYKQIFKELNLLLFRFDYLANQDYTE